MVINVQVYDPGFLSGQADTEACLTGAAG